MLNHSPVGGCCGDSLVYSCSGAKVQADLDGVFLAIRKLSNAGCGRKTDGLPESEAGYVVLHYPRGN